MIMIKTLVYDSKIIVKMLVADTFIKRFLGFMFRKNPHYEAILFKPCNSIHTFFMKFTIDVLFINENMEVVKKVSGLKPWKVIMPQKKATMLIEGKSGLFENVKEGEQIKMVDSL